MRKTPSLASREWLPVEGVEIEMPKAKVGGKSRYREWQRRVLPDLVPDSVNADAPERTPFRIVHALTSLTGFEKSTDIETVFAGELAGLEGLFRRQTKGRRKMTLAFHVLAVKATGTEERSAKGFTERTFLLLCRDPDGRVDTQLVDDVVEQFRGAPEKLDLAQRVVLNALSPHWTPEQEPAFYPDPCGDRCVPFDRHAADMFQDDLRCLLQAKLDPADFFSHLNILLVLHLGLYQPRLAALLNPQMDILFAEMAKPTPDNLAKLESLLEEQQRRHPFTGSVHCRAPDGGFQRRVNKRSASLVSFEHMAHELTIFHFNVLLLTRLRRLGEAYLATKLGIFEQWKADKLDEDARFTLEEATRGPLEFVRRMREDAEFGRFLHRSLEALAVAFADDQLAAKDEQVKNAIDEAESGLHALRDLYHIYNRNNSGSNTTSSRAYKQGIQVSSSLLRHNQEGLLQIRRGVGTYFELGVGLLPMLLLLTVGAANEKIPVDGFWARLERYGLAFDKEERGYLLERLRAMGVYERYSDAGEAAYVRNLMLPR